MPKWCVYSANSTYRVLAVVRILKLNIMRSKVTKIILSETSEQTKEKVRNYANNLINKKNENRR